MARDRRDDDEDDRPRRRRRDEDDDFDDDRPTRRSSRRDDEDAPRPRRTSRGGGSGGGSGRSVLGLVVIVLVILFVVGGVLFALALVPKRTTYDSGAAAPSGGPGQNSAAPLKVTSTELLAAYTRDPAAARSKYSGMTVEVTGTVRRVDRFGPIPTLHLGSAGDFEKEAACTFKAGGGGKLANLSADQTVTVVGTCMGNDAGWIELTECTLVK